MNETAYSQQIIETVQSYCSTMHYHCEYATKMEARTTHLPHISTCMHTYANASKPVWVHMHTHTHST